MKTEKDQAALKSLTDNLVPFVTQLIDDYKQNPHELTAKIPFEQYACGDDYVEVFPIQQKELSSEITHLDLSTENKLRELD